MNSVRRTKSKKSSDSKNRISKSYMFLWIKDMEKAIASQDGNSIQNLLKKVHEYTKYGKSKYTVFHYLVKKNKITIVDYLIKRGWDVNSDDNRREYPLLFQAYNNVEMTKILINAGAELDNNFYVHGMGPLHVPCSLPVYKVFIEAGCDVNATDDSGLTPLHFVIFQPNPNLEIMRALFDAGCDLNKPSKSGFTALHYTANYMEYKATKFLLEHGASVNALDQNGLSPLSYCFIEEVNNHMAHVRGCLHHRRKRITSCADLMLKHGAKINHPNAHLSPLYIVLGEAYLKNLRSDKEVLFLLTRGATFDFDHEPVKRAIATNEVFAKYLIRHAAMFDARNQSNEGPRNLRIEELDSWMMQYYMCCEDELKKMRDTPVYNVFTLWNVLRDKKAQPYLGYVKVLRRFKELNTSINFPIYDDLLTERFYAMRKYQKHLQKATIGLRHLLRLNSSTHAIIFDRILDNFGCDELETLAMVGKCF